MAGFSRDEAECLVSHLSGNSWRFQQPSMASDCCNQSDSNIADQISRLEIECYMRNQLLRDSDVMSMKWGLELRVPFVDSKLIDSVSMISSAVRLAPGKALLKQAVPELPDWVLRQPKRGFRFPFEHWAKDCWRDWFRNIDEASPVNCGTWYRRWCLIALQHFLETNHVAYAGKRFDRASH
jgi:asparagine synthase (glutamine-hydrolysing)